MTSSARARRPVGRKSRRMGFSGQVLAPLLRSLSSQRVVDSGNFPSRSQSRVPFRAPVRRPFVVSTVGDSLETFAEGSPNSSQIVLAVAHGNRTHRGRLSAPATGFEDRASHQIRKRYRAVHTVKAAWLHTVFVIPDREADLSRSAHFKFSSMCAGWRDCAARRGLPDLAARGGSPAANGIRVSGLERAELFVRWAVRAD